MTKFQATIESEAIVGAARNKIWDVLTDPKLLAELTPLLRRIDAHGDTWTWHLTRIAALGVSISPAFTEQMRFEDGSRIDYTHRPPNGVKERAGAEGWYELRDVSDGTQLAISLTLCVELPLPRAATPAVQRVMRSMMRRTGDKFSANLLNHLGANEVAGSSAR
jgi:carbon monoxide dehydrogenase subunit G